MRRWLLNMAFRVRRSGRNRFSSVRAGLPCFEEALSQHQSARLAPNQRVTPLAIGGHRSVSHEWPRRHLVYSAPGQTLTPPTCRATQERTLRPE